MTQQNTILCEPIARCATAIATTPVQRFSVSNPLNPDDLLGELFAATFYKRPLGPLTRWWLQKGILRAIRRNESLDEALSLKGSGRDTLQRRLLMMRRNQHLAEAIGATALDEQVSEWQRCLRLAPEVKRFMRMTWPKTMRLSAPPDDWPSFKKCLWHAACSDLSLPQSADGLRRVLEQSKGYSCKNSGATLLAQFL